MLDSPGINMDEPEEAEPTEAEGGQFDIADEQLDCVVGGNGSGPRIVIELPEL